MAFLNETKLPPAILTTEHSAMSPPPRPSPSHGRSTSHATAVRSSKRLSLSFPVQFESDQDQKLPKSFSSLSSTSPVSCTPISSSERTASPADSSIFLTALATKERRVMELKEELQRAELDLEKLKKQWALYEATRKRDEIRNIGRLETFKSPLKRAPLFESNNGSARMNKEHERRRAMYAGTRQQQRKVFSGSRHTGTLSLLLSPNTSTYSQKSRSGEELRSADEGGVDSKLGRSTTVPNSLGSTAATAKGSTRASIPIAVGPQKDALLQTGKQIVGDFKEGLWTFIEDLRQATVGEEAVNGSDTRVSPVSANRRTAKKQTTQAGSSLKDMPSPTRRNVTIDVSPTQLRDATGVGGPPLVDLSRAFRDEDRVKHTESMSTTAYESNSRRENKDSTNIDDDGWENWESPAAKSASPKWSDCTCTSEHATPPSTVRTSPRTSMRYVAFRQTWT